MERRQLLGLLPCFWMGFCWGSVGTTADSPASRLAAGSNWRRRFGRERHLPWFRCNLFVYNLVPWHSCSCVMDQFAIFLFSPLLPLTALLNFREWNVILERDESPTGNSQMLRQNHSSMKIAASRSPVTRKYMLLIHSHSWSTVFVLMIRGSSFLSTGAMCPFRGRASTGGEDAAVGAGRQDGYQWNERFLFGIWYYLRDMRRHWGVPRFSVHLQGLAVVRVVCACPVWCIA